MTAACEQRGSSLTCECLSFLESLSPLWSQRWSLAPPDLSGLIAVAADPDGAELHTAAALLAIKGWASAGGPKAKESARRRLASAALGPAALVASLELGGMDDAVVMAALKSRAATHPATACEALRTFLVVAAVEDEPKAGAGGNGPGSEEGKTEGARARALAEVLLIARGSAARGESDSSGWPLPVAEAVAQLLRSFPEEPVALACVLAPPTPSEAAVHVLQGAVDGFDLDAWATILGWILAQIATFPESPTGDQCHQGIVDLVVTS